MIRLKEFKLPLEHAEEALREGILDRLKIPAGDLIRMIIFRRAVDARRLNDILFVYTLDLELRQETEILKRFETDRHVDVAPDLRYKFVAGASANSGLRPVVIGMGPAGLFAGLILAQSGYRPIILERGKAVRERTKDTFGLWRKGILNPESNVQFGEGGAGTFSDGKLHSQIKDRKHYARKVLMEFVKAGAPEEILYVSKPHIGTFRLVSVMEKMRATLQALGAEIRFESRVDDIEIDDGQIQGVHLAEGEHVATNHLVLAIGHSARDTFEMLHRRGVFLEAKAFSIGFRIEHPQSLIDRDRYGAQAGNPLLGAADYKLIYHARNGRSVYSFCMCPGGQIVAAVAQPGLLCTNGMSNSKHSSPFANSGLVVTLGPREFGDGVFDGVAFLEQIEARFFDAGGGDYSVPAQQVPDFLAGSESVSLSQSSYKLGLRATRIDGLLPRSMTEAIRAAFRCFDQQIPGYAGHAGLLVGIESRSSGPLRMPRDSKTRVAHGFENVFPVGEGAGYAGGIMSAAIDGARTAWALLAQP